MLTTEALVAEKPKDDARGPGCRAAACGGMGGMM